MKIFMALAFVVACGGSKPAAQTQTPPENQEPVATPTEPTTADPKSCEAQGGKCTSKMAAVACATWPEANDCGQNEGCCVMSAPANK